MNKKIIVSEGDKFGKLTVIKELETEKYRRRILCKCECGNEKGILLGHLIRGKIKSCGCLIYKHGMKYTRFYKIYDGINGRCKRISHMHYKNYGGRGIKNEWTSFEEFYNDMYESYLEHEKIYGTKNTTIDRINNNGNYCKSNCKWVTQKEQTRNTRKNRIYKGKCISEWIELLGLNKTKIFNGLRYHTEKEILGF